MPIKVSLERIGKEEYVSLPDILPEEEKAVAKRIKLLEGKERFGGMITAICDAEDEFGVVHFEDDKGLPCVMCLVPGLNTRFTELVNSCLGYPDSDGIIHLEFYNASVVVDRLDE